LHGGARVALRANGIIGATVVFLFALDIDAVAHLRVMLLELVAHTPDWGARGELAGLCVILAAAAMPRVALGSTGWIRSLPCSGATSRRATIAALGATQAFAIVVAFVALVAALAVYHKPIDPAKVVGIALMIPAAAAVVLPTQRRAGQVAFALALGLTVPGRWVTDAAALGALVLGDAVAGRIVPFRSNHARRGRGVAAGTSPVALWMRFTLRAVPGASLMAMLFFPGLLVAFGYLIVLHNPDLDHATATRTVRVCGALSLAAFASGLATTIVRARPTWPWARSLPWSSNERVLGDMVVHAVPLVALALSFMPLDWVSASVVLCLAPPLAAAAAASIRSGARRQTSAGGEVVALAVLFGALIALLPWTAGLVVVSTPLIIAGAVKRDRRLLVTRWEELHHDAAGDPAWMVTS
jgi:hypothetical protein